MSNGPDHDEQWLILVTYPPDDDEGFDANHGMYAEGGLGLHVHVPPKGHKQVTPGLLLVLW